MYRSSHRAFENVAGVLRRQVRVSTRALVKKRVVCVFGVSPGEYLFPAWAAQVVLEPVPIASPPATALPVVKVFEVQDLAPDVSVSLRNDDHTIARCSFYRIV